jgi:hypothetical protein
MYTPRATHTNNAGRYRERILPSSRKHLLADTLTAVVDRLG